jgi:cytoskeletal protein CcmA (bactofilin family)
MEKKENVDAFLGVGTEFAGSLKFHGAVRIDGRYEGDITAIGSLFVGKGGVAKADARVTSIAISGEFHGNIAADEKIEIMATGKVYGNIHAPTIIIHEGSVLEGNCQTSAPKEPDEGKSAGVRKIKTGKKRIFS